MELYFSREGFVKRLKRTLTDIEGLGKHIKRCKLRSSVLVCTRNSCQRRTDVGQQLPSPHKNFGSVHLFTIIVEDSDLPIKNSMYWLGWTWEAFNISS